MSQIFKSTIKILAIIQKSKEFDIKQTIVWNCFHIVTNPYVHRCIVNRNILYYIYTKTDVSVLITDGQILKCELCSCRNI